MSITAEAFDGSTHEFPDDTPPEKIRDVIAQYTNQKKRENEREPLKAIGQGFIDFGGDIWDALRGKTPRELTSYIARGKPQGEEIFSPSTAQVLGEKFGTTRGQNLNPAENMVLSGIETAANPSSWIGAGTALAKAAVGGLAGVVSEGAGELTHFFGGSRTAEELARIGGGFTGGHLAGGHEKRALIKEGEEKLKSGETLHDKSQQAYAELAASPASITPAGMVDLNREIQTELQVEHFSPVTARRTFGILHKNFRSGRAMDEAARVNLINAQLAQNAAAMRRLQRQPPTPVIRRLQAALTNERARLEQARSNPYANAAMSRKVSDVIDIYEELGNVAPDVDAKDAAAAQIARSTLREWLEKNAPEGTNETLHRATRDWAAHKQIEEIEKVLSVGEHRADVSGSGFNMENTLRQEIRKILDNEKRFRGKSKAWKDQAEYIIRGSMIGNVARSLGRTTWINSPVSTLALSFINRPLAAGLFGVTHGARKLGEFLTQREVERLITIIQEEAPSNKYRAGQNRALRRNLGHGSKRTGFHPSRPDMRGISGAEAVGESPQTRDKPHITVHPRTSDAEGPAETTFGQVGPEDASKYPMIAKTRQFADASLQDLGIMTTPWTGPETALLKTALRGGKSWPEIIKMFPERSLKALQHQAKRLLGGGTRAQDPAATARAAERAASQAATPAPGWSNRMLDEIDRRRSMNQVLANPTVDLGE